MSGFIQGEDRFQATLFPERLDDYVAEPMLSWPLMAAADQAEPAEDKTRTLEDKIAEDNEYE